MGNEMLLWEKAAFWVLSILPGCFSTFSETIEAIKVYSQ